MTATTNVSREHCIQTIISLSALRCFEIDKATESAMLQAFNSLVPRNTYLADYLDGAAEDFERSMQVDVVMPCYHRVREMRDEIVLAKKELATVHQAIKDAEQKLRSVNSEVVYAKRQAAELAESVKGIDDSLTAIRRVAREIKFA